MHAAEGILTARGGMTSHAAVVARGMGRPCVAGAGDVRIDGKAGTLTVRGTMREGGRVHHHRRRHRRGHAGRRADRAAGAVAATSPTLMGWADEVRTLDVRANAETPPTPRTARKFGAEGIGLCRTEHMFFDADRIVAVREMILADDEKGRRAALAKLLPMQREDFVELFEIMERPAGDHPPARSAAARVPAAQTREMEEVARRPGRRGRPRSRRAPHEAARGQSDARPSRLPARHLLSRNLRDAGARHLRGGAEVQKKAARRVMPEIMIPLVATAQGARPHEGA